MAFVEVIRRSLRSEEWTDLRFGYLKRGIIKDCQEITGLRIKDRIQTGDNSYKDISDWRDLAKDDIIFTPDGNIIITGQGMISEKFKGHEVYLHLHTAAEMIVKVNGSFAGGMDPNRNRLLLNPFVGTDGLVNFEIEGYNRSKPDDERNPDTMNDRGCRQIFQGLYFVIINKDVLDLYYDLIALIDIAKSPHFDEDYRSYLNKELETALNLVDLTTYEGADKSRKYLDEKVFSNRDFKSSGNVALVGHSHLDIAYYWRRIHTVQKNARTILIQMRLMDRYPDFKYCHTQPFLYETLEKNYPELFSELKKKVKSGQFEPVGAMYVEPDCNIPAAESLVRQCLYGQHFYRRAFGITVDSAWLPDVFGNSWILPQILEKSGVDYFVSNKMSTWNDTNRFPHNNFVWKGIDGSKIYACVPPTHFITWNMPSQVKENWDAYIDKEYGGQTLSMFGYGDGGSGATEEMIELMHRFDRLSIMPHTEHMRADEFLHRNLKDNGALEVWDGELYLEMHRGTFTTKSLLKRYNRMLEFRLRDVELLFLCRMNEGLRYPAEELRALYKQLLLNQFHDIIPGSHINPVYEDAITDYRAMEDSLDRLVGIGSGYLFNTLNHYRREPVFIEDTNGKFARKGRRGAYRLVESEGLSSIPLPSPEPEDSSTWFSCKGSTVQTGYYRLVFNSDGSISSLKDRNTGREYVNGCINRLHLYQDMPGMYDSWDILPNYKDIEYELVVMEPFHFVQADSQCALFSVTLNTPECKSSWTMLIKVFKDSPLIEIENLVDWNEKHRLAKTTFNINALSRELVCDTSAGYIKRETHRNTSWQKARFECCCHKWCDFSEAGGGIAVINEGKYGVGIEENGFSLSLLRSNIRPDIISDIGKHNIIYAIYPHNGSFLDAGVNRLAFDYNVPFLPTGAPYSLPWRFPGLYLQSAKLSEDEKSIVFRLSEQDGGRGSFALGGVYKTMNMLEDVTGECTELEYKPFEIITIAKEIGL
ncbi:glycoside hydrolase family 38 C-terminal domain-containing protein [uncultured Sphaerochaeta sp.]|uniref:alpha-mannosidase n=1 Tax=uncultured Sphaerochaeta sp. TaxID=886478 RepID=UPI002A0A6DE9|nr:glycoside hydrolase family 38 C-terminal domain-containing protein [uncultured Sphaerochaeta sp.]